MFRVFVSLALTFSYSVAPACTTFLLNGNSPVMGKSLDWYVHHGMAVTNLRGMQKKALLLDPSSATALEWVSKYGSISFNQVSEEFPFGGMNEKGLAVEILWLTDSDYPALKANVPSVNESQWIQYLLDSAATTDEAVQLIEGLQVQMAFAPVHYTICDASADCATVEYVNKSLLIHRGATLPYMALTNDTYDNSLTYLKDFTGFGGNKSLPATSESLDRFVIATSMAVNTPASADLVKRSFEILTHVASEDQVWRVSYDLKNQKIRFTTVESTAITELDLSTLEFDCKKSSALFMDMNAPQAFTPLTAAQNALMLQKTDYLPPKIKQLIAGYLTTPACLK